ncbi:acyl carrier protein [Leptolyngbyaceae cyanobacterium CCMR0082]|uniref:Acyl carrier protein n=3 Tax=Adonisia TaxID=2950183 RepID=A0A6M0SFW3_9CYAN|nr:acyl carrier protein [Adonisia turfae]MDV3348400.1 acyl carrier protein [Leptothoe sp. LEGE 181152]NEZ58799.1 acyl carrier protein [Adonisia turfae CCMR0081]NEZ67429.1 acyl carrier protein [Adonisia turfae CCMR0082]
MNSSVNPQPSVMDQPTIANIEAWLSERLAESLGTTIEGIDPDAPFDSYGLDSTEVIGLSGELEEWLQRQVSPTLLYDYPTIATLAEHLGDLSLETEGQES